MRISTSSAFHSGIKQIFGINVKQQNHFVQSGHDLALVSGSSIIIYNPKTDEQVQFISHSSSNISCIAVTFDGALLAVAESTKGSLISVYDLQGKVISKPKYTMKGHKYGVSMMEWSPTGKYLVSISNDDGGMFVWEREARISQNKLGRVINKLIFTKEGNLITVGKQHFKIWPFDNGKIIRTQVNECWMMDGKTFILGKMFSEKQFINVAQRNSRFVALTSDGLLCSINNDTIEKAVDLQMSQPRGLDIFQKWAICGGQNASIKVIDIDTLLLVSTFPKPPPENIEVGQAIEETQGNYSPCIGIKTLSNYIVSLYSNRTIVIWQISNSNISPVRCFMGHSEQIICLQLLYQKHNQMSVFATSSCDKSIRIWHLYGQYFDNKQPIDFASTIGLKRNAYCKNLTRIINTEEVIQHMKATQNLLIAASSNTIYVYSLNSFSLLYQLPIEGMIINALEAKNNQLLIALSNNTIKIFTLSETMLKGIKIIDTKVTVQEIKLVDRNMVMISKGAFIIVDLDTDTVFKEEKDVSTICLVDNRELNYIKADKLHTYSLVKKKEKQALNLQSQSFDLKGKLRIISNFILLLSPKQKQSSFMRVWNNEGYLIYEQQYHQAIQNIQLCADGHCIIANRNGPIIVEEFIYRDKFTKINKQFRKCFEENEFSWIAGSVWVSQDLKNLKADKAEDLLSNITQPQKKKISDQILVDSTEIFIPGNPHMNVNIPYKRDDQRLSIFNPSLISDQVNKIISNVNDIQKKFQGKQSPRAFDIEDLKFSGESSKLVESIIPDFKPKNNNFLKPPQPQEEMLLSGNQRLGEKVESEIPIDTAVDTIYQELNGETYSKRQFISTHEVKLKSIYDHLHGHFSNSNTTANAIQKLSTSYLNELRSLLSQL